MLIESGTLHNPSSRGGCQCFFSVLSFYFFPYRIYWISCNLLLCDFFGFITNQYLFTSHWTQLQTRKTISLWYSLVNGWGLDSRATVCPRGPPQHGDGSWELQYPGLPAQLAGCSPSWRVSSSWQLLLFVPPWGEACESCKFQELPRLCKSFTYTPLCFFYFPSLMSLLSLQVGLFQFRGNSYITLIARFILNNVWCYELWRTYEIKHPSLKSGQKGSISPFNTLQFTLCLIFHPWKLLHIIPLYNGDILNTQVLFQPLGLHNEWKKSIKNFLIDVKN